MDDERVERVRRALATADHYQHGPDYYERLAMVALQAADMDESPYPTQAQMDAEDREDWYRVIACLREHREDTRLAGESCADWAIRLLSNPT